MRYSVNAAGVAAVMMDVSSCFNDVASAVTRSLAAADQCVAALRADAAGVLRALDDVLAGRRRSGPGISPYTAGVAERVRQAVLAYVEGDEQMATQTSAAAASVDSCVFSADRWRGVRP